VPAFVEILTFQEVLGEGWFIMGSAVVSAFQHPEDISLFI